MDDVPDEVDTANPTSKVTEWYANPAAMLAEHPLSQDAERQREAHPLLGPALVMKEMRILFRSVKGHPAHSFQYKGTWKSVSVDAMATFYEDMVLHEVGTNSNG